MLAGGGGGEFLLFGGGHPTPTPFFSHHVPERAWTRSVHGHQMFLCSDCLVVAIITVLVLTYYQLLVISFAKSFFWKIKTFDLMKCLCSYAHLRHTYSMLMRTHASRCTYSMCAH